MQVQELKKNPTLEEEEVKALKEELRSYQGLLQQLLDKAPRQICKIKIGPLLVDGNAFYKVMTPGGQMELAGFKEEYVFKQGHKGKLDVNREVIVCAGVIIGLVPELLIIKEVLPTFQLIDWSNIGGLKSQIDTIKEATELPLNNSALVKDLGLKPMKGILLYGPPGCGREKILLN